MNDRYDGYGDQYELIGYDEGGRPVYRPVPPRRPAPDVPQYGDGGGGYDPYGPGPSGAGGQGGYGDPYGNNPGYDHAGRPQGGGYPSQQHQQTAPQPTVPPQSGYGSGRPPGAPPQEPYDTGSYDTGSYDRSGYDTGSHDMGSYGSGRAGSYGTQGGPGPQGGPAGPGRPGPGRDGDDGYHTEQFAFVEEENDDSEDVIDWLKFTESRTERREEARRRAHSRMVALVVVLALALVGGVGYLWHAGKLPALPGQGDSTDATATATGPQNRDAIVVHLRNTKDGSSSTALLVDNTTTKHGATILIPNELSLTDDDGDTTTLGKSVSDDGSSGTRDSLNSLLGTQIQGTWRLDTPYLENLVDLVGSINVDTNTSVPDPSAKKTKGKTPEPLVNKGTDQTLSGRMAVAYATYRAPGEADTAQLDRFGQVMLGVLRKMSSDPGSATVTVQTLAQILDPSLTDKDLGAFLAKLADHAKDGDYTTKLLPVQSGGTLSEQTTDDVVKKLLGGTVKPAGKDAALRVDLKNATGASKSGQSARIALVNGGYTVLDGTSAPAQATSQVGYSDPKHKEDATEVAKTLDLPTSDVRKVGSAGSGDVMVVLGEDYKAGTP